MWLAWVFGAVLIVFAACTEMGPVDPQDEDQQTTTTVAHGDVHYSCTIESGTGNLINCTFTCVEDDEVFFWDTNGDGVCGSPGGGGPEPDGPGDPGHPPGGGTPPPPAEEDVEVALNCSKSVLRGSPGGCALSVEPFNAPINDLSWSFVHFDGSPGQVGGTSWSGKVVAPGEVLLTFSIGSFPPTVLRDSITVNDRLGTGTWTWGPGDWNLDTQHSPLAIHIQTTSNFTAGSGVLLGLWCDNKENGGCDANYGFMRPDIQAGETGAYSLAEITDGGPNDGMWYVANADFYSETINAVHPNLLGGSVHTNMTSCSNLDWPTANHCMGTGTAAGLLAIGIMRHEGMGSTLSNGHEPVARSIASRPGYDPIQAIEGLVAFDLSTLEGAVVFAIAGVRDRIHLGIQAAGHPSGNFSPQSVHMPSGNQWASWILSEPN